MTRTDAHVPFGHRLLRKLTGRHTNPTPSDKPTQSDIDQRARANTAEHDRQRQIRRAQAANAEHEAQRKARRER